MDNLGIVPKPRSSTHHEAMVNKLISQAIITGCSMLVALCHTNANFINT